MKKTILSLAVVALLAGCATGSGIREKLTGEQFDSPKVEESKYLKKDSNKLLPPAGGPMPVAVYGFRDLTGQRKSQPLIASLSSAVTQGAENYLIKALQDVGDQRWFTVLERVGLENLIKERQMIRQMREQYQGREAKMLPPMIFAGIIMEGGIVGYDSNTLTGGSGVRLFGIGASTQYQSDTVTVTLRTVSVSTGEILTTVTVTKTVLSYMDKVTLLRFVGDGTSLGANANALEGEIGGSINESINKAIDVAVQAAVVNTINEGARKGHWSFKQEQKVELVQPQLSKIESSEANKAVEAKVEPKQEVKPTVKVEDKKEVVVQPETKIESPADLKPVVSKQELKVEPKPLFGQRKLKEAEFIYKEPNDKSQKTWMFKKGTIVNVVQPGSEGWVSVMDSEKRGGWIKVEQTEEIK